MKWQDYIEQRPDILRGKPVFKGTRLSVQMILEERSSGSNEDELLEAYPTLKHEHLRAVDAYAANLINLDESIFAVS